MTSNGETHFIGDACPGGHRPNPITGPTSGPWHAYPDTEGNWHISRTHTPPQTNTPIAPTVENARRIAAAPDMEKALEAITCFWDTVDKEGRPEGMTQALEALSKAKGE